MEQGKKQIYAATEKSMILKSVDIFSATPEENLIEVASIVEEISVKKRGLIFLLLYYNNMLYIL